jgi:hypothetical protein
VASSEWWVMRVVVPKGSAVTAQQEHDVERGVLCVVNGDVCEPIDMFEGSKAQERSISVMARLQAANPRETYKTVLSTDDL